MPVDPDVLRSLVVAAVSALAIGFLNWWSKRRIPSENAVSTLVQYISTLHTKIELLEKEVADLKAGERKK